MSEGRVEVYEDEDGRFHYQHRPFRMENAKFTPMLCGRSTEGLRRAAWFTAGDARGRVHYDLGCEPCRNLLVY